MTIRTAATVALTLLSFTPTLAAQSNRVVQLEWIRSSAGRYDGPAAGELAGRAISAAGDVNGDGFDDFMVSGYDIGFLDGPGKTWLVYGTAFGLPETAALGGDVTLTGNQNADWAGVSVSAAGDVNNDGFDDVLIGSSRWDGGTGADFGRAYVVFGSATLPSSIALGSLSAATGVILEGAAFSELTGERVAGLGDVNGDTFPDMLITAPGVAAGGVNLSGQAYIVYGGPSLPAVVDLGSLSAADGVVIEGISNGDRWGNTGAAAGDVNNDGFADTLIASYFANPAGKNNAGQAAIIYGGAALPGLIDLAALGSAGVNINGENPGDALGFSAAGGGDVNGDGFDDVIVGADDYSSKRGRAYVVYGGASLPNNINVGSLGSAGIVLTGAAAADEAGHAVAMGGDINRDGYADFVVGSLNADGNGTSSGEVYLIHGGPALPSSFDLGAVSWRGEQFNGASAGARVGDTLAFLGDVNNDGFGDFGFGSRFADDNGTDAGQAWVIPGGCHWLLAEGSLAEGDTFTMRAYGTPNSQWLPFLSAGIQPTPFNTSKGPFWLANPFLELSVLSFDSNGEGSLPLTIPTGFGLSGFPIYWQYVQTPQGFNCDLSRLLTTTIE
ncbi:MAG: hypothetical protein ACI9EF_003622 [Pseudohongiellaceae bacterium]|jgi:hypothetical protein